MCRGLSVPFIVQIITEMIDKGVVNQLVEDYFLDKNLFIVGVDITQDNHIRIQIDSNSGVSIDDCAELTNHILSKLDRDIEDYELEVGSAGISSPFKVHQQYVKNIGKEVEVLLRKGQKEKGVLKSVTDDGVTLTTTQNVKLEGAKRKTTVQNDIFIAFNDIKTTKLIIRFK